MGTEDVSLEFRGPQPCVFDPGAMVERMSRFPLVVRSCVEGSSRADLRRRSPRGAWSVGEILCHLVDEEVEDFGPRLRSTLEDPTRPWPRTDPEGLAIERKYAEQDPLLALARFEQAREGSIAWLREVLATTPPDDPRWRHAYHHPSGRVIRAGDLLTSWGAHDMLHLRQIAKRMFEWSWRDGGSGEGGGAAGEGGGGAGEGGGAAGKGGFSAEYAGPWGA
ncbi:MAG: DinB family protein [Phycisphaerales bacterium]|nr:MAG: DinB family protein [Phycisphaerales bacterium]